MSSRFTRQQIADIINQEVGFDIAEDDGCDVELNYHKDGYKLHDWVMCDDDFYPFVKIDSYDKEVVICSENDSESESYEINDSNYVDDSDIDYEFYQEEDVYYIEEQEIIDFAHRLKRILNISDDVCLEVSIEDLCL